MLTGCQSVPVVDLDQPLTTSQISAYTEVLKAELPESHANLLMDYKESHAVGKGVFSDATLDKIMHGVGTVIDQQFDSTRSQKIIAINMEAFNALSEVEQNKFFSGAFDDMGFENVEVSAENIHSFANQVKDGAPKGTALASMQSADLKNTDGDMISYTFATMSVYDSELKVMIDPIVENHSEYDASDIASVATKFVITHETCHAYMSAGLFDQEQQNIRLSLAGDTYDNDMLDSNRNPMAVLAKTIAMSGSSVTHSGEVIADECSYNFLHHNLKGKEKELLDIIAIEGRQADWERFQNREFVNASMHDHLTFPILKNFMEFSKNHGAEFSQTLNESASFSVSHMSKVQALSDVNYSAINNPSKDLKDYIVEQKDSIRASIVEMRDGGETPTQKSRHDIISNLPEGSQKLDNYFDSVNGWAQKVEKASKFIAKSRSASSAIVENAHKIVDDVTVSAFSAQIQESSDLATLQTTTSDDNLEVSVGDNVSGAFKFNEDDVKDLMLVKQSEGEAQPPKINSTTLIKKMKF